MKRKKKLKTVVAMVFYFFTLTTYGQHNISNGYWVVDQGVKTCSIVLDLSLTQDQLMRFSRQAAGITSFKSLANAEVIGQNYFSIVIERSATPNLYNETHKIR